MTSSSSCCCCWGGLLKTDVDLSVLEVRRKEVQVELIERTEELLLHLLLLLLLLLWLEWKPGEEQFR